jgi:hypothetical protein
MLPRQIVTLLGRASGPVSIIDPLPSGSLIVTGGDSINEFDFNAGTAAQRTSGLIMNASANGGGEVVAALVMDPTLCYYDAWNDTTDTTGLVGNTGRYYAGGDVAQAGAVSADIVAQVTRAVAYANGAVPLVVLGGGTNYLGVSDATFLTQKLAEIDAWRAGFPRSPILVQGVRPVSFAASGTGSRTAANTTAKNVQVQAAVAARAGCYYVDMSGYADDSGNPGYALPIFSHTAPYQASPGGDGLHPGPYGAYIHGGPAMLAAIQAHVQSGSNLIPLRKVASVLPAGMGTNTGSSAVSHTAGTGGGVISGNVPTSMDVAHGSAANVSSCVCSLEANAETGGQKLVLTITPGGTATNEGFVIRPSLISITTAALQNQWTRMWAKIEADQGAGLMQVNVQAAEKSNGVNNNTNCPYVGLFPRGSGSRFFYPQTAPLKFVAGSTGVNPSITVRINPSLGGGPYVVKLWQWDIQTEASPVRP